MAHNCLIEEARESIFTGLEGVADAKSAGAFVLIGDGLKERSEKKCITHISAEFNKARLLRLGKTVIRQAVFIRANEVNMGTLAHDRRVKLQQMRHKLKPYHRAEINQEHINRVKKHGTFSFVPLQFHI